MLIPKVYPRLSSRRVLTMSRLEGYAFSDILKPGVEQSLKDWVAIKYYRLLWRQIFEFGVVHTDPHPRRKAVDAHAFHLLARGDHRPQRGRGVPENRHQTVAHALDDVSTRLQ